MASELEVGKVVVGDSTNNHAWVTTKSTAGYYSGIKLTRGAGTFADDANNNFGFIVTDAGLSAAKFTSPGADVTGRGDLLILDSTGAVSIPSAAGTQIALTVKGGNDLVDNIALNLTNQSGTGVANIRNNGRIHTSAGIVFDSQTNSAVAGVSDDSTTLNHYESGSWSPTLHKGTIGGTLTQHTGASVYGKYVRIGNLVWISFYVLQGAGGTQSASGQWVVKGLPFTVKEGAAAGHQSIPSNYFQLNGTNFFNASPHRWQANATDALQMYGAQNATTWSSGAMEFGGAGVLHIDY